MLGVKVTPQNLRQVLHTAKNHFHNAYHQTRNFFGNVDNAVKMGKRVYQVLEPMISQYAGANNYNATHNGVMRGLSGYESLRNKVVEHHNDALNVVSHLKKNMPKLGLT